MTDAVVHKMSVVPGTPMPCCGRYRLPDEIWTNTDHWVTCTGKVGPLVESALALVEPWKNADQIVTGVFVFGKANPDAGGGIAHDFYCGHDPCRCVQARDLTEYLYFYFNADEYTDYRQHSADGDAYPIDEAACSKLAVALIAEGFTTGARDNPQ